MNSRFKFPRRVRIHGGECGAVARALHHEAKNSSLPAVKKNVFFTTNERKSMSTKTTLKRIALVAVSALGAGVLSVIAVPTANAAAVTSVTPAFSSYTIVGTAGDDAAIVRIVVKDSLGVADSLAATGDTMTARTLSVPNKVGTTTACTKPIISATNATGTPYLPSNSGSLDNSVIAGPTVSHGVDGAVQYFKVQMNDDCADAGSVVVRFTTFTDGSSYSTVGGYADVKFQSVTNTLGLSGATITLTSAATTVTASNGAVFGDDDAESVTVSATDANGGVIVNSSAGNTAPYYDEDYGNTTDEYTPVVDMTWTLSTTVVYETAGSLSDASTVDDNVPTDGVYNVEWSTDKNAIGTNGAGKTHTIRAYFPGNTKVTKTLAVVATTSGSSAIFYGVTATGKYEATAGSSTTGGAYEVPLSTKSATYSVYVSASSVALTGYSMYYSIDYGTSCVLADMSPEESTSSATPTKVLTDANGIASVTITNANPVTGCIATVTWTGAATNVSDTTITWKESTPTTAVADTGSIQALLKSTNKITWTILDQYGAAVVGKTVTFTMTGENAPTAGLASQVTDANGQVSVSITDALAATTETDTVLVNKVGATTLASGSNGSVTITYKTTLDAIATMTIKYTNVDVTTAAVIPTTAIGGTTGRLISTADQLDTSKNMTATITADTDAATDEYWNKFTITLLKSDGITGVSGIPTTVAVTGAYLLDSAGKFATSRKFYSNGDVVTIVGTKTGVATVTFTNGTLSSTATINYVNVKEDARVLALTEKDGTFTATVTDFAGNAVADVTVNVSAVGSTFGNAGSSTSFVTDANGKVTFDATGAGTVTASLSASTYAKTANLKDAGNSTGTVVTPGAPAGVRTVSVATSGKVNASLAAAEAASDAAAEAIDAANAATDAANLAAEAADAATVAAEEARDAADAATAAVEELATQVATLMAALKAQITTLANTVAKIAKKVKA